MNTKILLRTINRLEDMERELKNLNFEFEILGDIMKVNVPFLRLSDFEGIIQKYLSTPFNYANVKFPDEKMNIIIFPERTFSVNNEQTDKIAKDWALSKGLPEPESKWTTVY